jgi:hypothetical protein
MNQPKYRRPLNDKQLAILSTIYCFRFVTSPLLGRLFNIKQSKAHARLQILLEQGFVGRRYDKTYRLQGKAAAYYMRPSGAEALAGKDKYAPEVLKRLIKDEGRSDRFIDHWRGVLDTYCRLNAKFGGRLKFFTNTQLTPYTYFMQPRPDAFLRIDQGPNERQYFLDYFDRSMPRFAMASRIRQFIEYAEDEEWQDTTKTRLPEVIIVYDNPQLKTKLKRMVREELEDSWIDEDLKIQLLTPDELTIYVQ